MRKPVRKDIPKYQAQKRAYYIRNHDQRLLEIAKRRAKASGLAFNITRADVVIPEYCPVLGLKLAPGRRGFTDSSPSIDRLDNTAGYVKGNICVISWRANSIKRNATLAELKALVAYVEMHTE